MAKRLLLSKPLLSWWVPYWSHCAATKRQWRRLFNVLSVLRILIGSCACCFVIVLCFRLAFPLMPLVNLRWLIIQIPGLFLAFYAMSWVHRAIPERVSVFDDCLLIQHGESAIHIAKSNVTDVRVVVFSRDAIRVRIWYDHKQRRRCRSFGLAREIKTAQLEAALSLTCSVFDARTRVEIRNRKSASLSS